MEDNSIEIELIDGSCTLIPNDWFRVYDVHEFTRKSCKFVVRFPFIKIIHERCTSFWVENLRGFPSYTYDKHYKARCTAVQLAKMFGMRVLEFEKTLVLSDVNVV